MAIDTAELAQITAWVSEHAATDVARLADGDVIDGLEAAAQLRKVSDALLARYAGEVDRRSGMGLPNGGLARAQGYGNANKFVSQVSGGSGGEARRLIQAGRAMAPVGSEDGGSVAEGAPARHPEIAAAMISGELSVESAGIIGESLDEMGSYVAPEKVLDLEARLVEKAKKITATEVKRMVKRAVAMADERGLQERERANFDNRYIAW